MDELQAAFIGSNRLQKHIKFLYEKGSMYKIFNNNLLYHGCVPLDEYGNFDGITLDGVVYQGKNTLIMQIKWQDLLILTMTTKMHSILCGFYGQVTSHHSAAVS